MYFGLFVLINSSFDYFCFGIRLFSWFATKKFPHERAPLSYYQEVGCFGIKDLLNFKETSRRHRYLVDKKATFRLLPRSYLRFFADDSLSDAKVRFMQRFSYSGRASVSVVLAAHLLLQPQPYLEAIKDILAKAVKH